MARPKILYHYTTGQGLIGIAETGKLWATERSFLNDRSETLHGISVLVEACERLKVEVESELPSSDEAREMVRTFTEQLTRDQKWASEIEWYVASLCEDPDLLTQWIGYGHQGGYSIGFDAEKLHEMRRESDDKQYFLSQVVYDREQQISKLLAQARRYVPGRVGASDEEKVETLHDEVRGCLLDLFLCKNQAFQHESEWRLWDFGTDVKLRHFRAARNMGVIPYMAFDVGKDKESLIREVWIGPTDQGPECVRAVEMLLDRHGLEGVLVHRSDIPLRW
jgi:hypothetical protein